jgi:putative Mn2+ efflux pump MntP
MSLMSLKKDDRIRRRLHRLRDWLVYVTVAIAVVSAAGVFGIYQARTGGDPGLPLKWLGFAAMTGVVFGYTIQDSRARWNESRFKIALALVFAAHMCLGILVLLYVDSVPLLAFAVLIPIEFFAIVKCLAGAR